MAKQTGLGDNLYVDGVNLSGDTGSLSAIGGGPAVLDLTGIDKSAFERRGGIRDGRIEWSSWFNPVNAHASLSDLPLTDRIVTYCRGTALGSPAASLVGKQVNYDPTRNADGSLSIALQALANGFGIDWGVLATPGIHTLAGAGAVESIDFGASSSFGLQAFLHVFSITGNSATVAIQGSSDDGDTDAFADIIAFEAATAAGAQRVQTSRDATIEQYLRVNVTGTFTDLDFAVVVTKNIQEVQF